MGRLMNILTPLHRRAGDRDYLHRMGDEKVHCMEVARRYEEDYWDGDRRYGYGGYKYDGRWEPVARQIIDIYALRPDATILDVGCGKAHLLYELSRLLPDAEVTGFDTSRHGLAHAKEEIRDRLCLHRAEDPYPFADQHFDFVLSLNTLHNLQVFELHAALREIERVGKQKYVSVESYRTCAELFNLQCWALTCEAFFRPEAWTWLFEHCGYSGDYEFVYFE